MEMRKFDKSGCLVVKENSYCEHWEPDDGALVPMKECWCCKWSRFRADNQNLASESIGVCEYSGNSEEVFNERQTVG